MKPGEWLREVELADGFQRMAGKHGQALMRWWTEWEESSKKAGFYSQRIVDRV